ncbi:MAG TPA: LrgB family protein [Pseudogulbenkiania sp.]|nr:LrgB family protein [Pseudogulbenkiania sp.]
MTLSPALEWLRGSPLLGLGLTLAAYRLALWLNRRAHGHPLTNSVLIGSLLVIAVLLGGGISPAEYMKGAQFIQLLLGPATVGLAIPLYHNLSRLKRAALPLTLTLLAGSLTGILSAVGLGMAFGLPHEILLSLMPRAVTTPIAIGIAEHIGGIPALAVTFVIVSGIFGAVIVKPLFSRLRLDDDLVMGVATGISAHGIGTARVFLLSETAGAFAGLAMGLNGVVTAVLVPIVLGFIRL